MKLRNVSFKMVYSFTSKGPEIIQNSSFSWSRFVNFLRNIFVYVYISADRVKQRRLQFVSKFKMATNTIIITYKKAYEIYKQLGLAQKRVNDRGKSDYEIIEDILHHERIELIDFSDQSLEPEKLVSFLL